ncbi:MAG TPA: hypothetical protein VGS96_07860 [Thermoanaerobaculia bacterium]|jgi:hypothetical protein|nr:hypothetical protein [Thermoanaerobaculia bacterium]
MTRDALQRVVAYGGALLLSVALLQRFYGRGGPYFRRPRTIVDHVDVVKHPTRDALILIPEVEPLLPRGVEVTCFRPKNGHAWSDSDNYLTAVGLLPHQFVLPPFTAASELRGEQVTEYVIAIGEPFEHPSYTPVAGFSSGWLYKRR